jgi:hypothetical protein
MRMTLTQTIGLAFALIIFASYVIAFGGAVREAWHHRKGI